MARSRIRHLRRLQDVVVRAVDKAKAIHALKGLRHYAGNIEKAYPAVKEGAVTAMTTPLHRGRTLAVLETELRNGDGKLVAKTTQSQAYLSD